PSFAAQATTLPQSDAQGPAPLTAVAPGSPLPRRASTPPASSPNLRRGRFLYQSPPWSLSTSTSASPQAPVLPSPPRKVRHGDPPLALFSSPATLPCCRLPPPFLIPHAPVGLCWDFGCGIRPSLHRVGFDDHRRVRSMATDGNHRCTRHAQSPLFSLDFDDGSGS
uniref:Uncharacterized protein n=1 Tax=Aegilops tauschii subsp. strangulata TaxID=200361 RepID=A0A453K483_AEGTS